jgi:formylglycine-generating enzyme required for sulfatase activity
MKSMERAMKTILPTLLALFVCLSAAACGSESSNFTDEDGDGWPPPADCDDTDAAIHPLATDTPYDGIDQDCSGRDKTDLDNDGYDDRAYGGTDCDDGDPDRYPGNLEIPYDDIDQDCDDADLRDVDGDGYDSVLVGGSDCDDDDRGINPGAAEIPYDGIDQDCDGLDFTGSTEGDEDEDGFIASTYPEGIDCDDSDPDIYPGAPERCNDKDDDCDGETDEGLLDLDLDGSPACKDCDDYDPARAPHLVEIPYDGIDQDCSGFDLEDVDGDGFKSDVVVGGLDCNDFDAQVNPAAPELCNRIDDDCNGTVDDNMNDADFDGWPDMCDCNANDPLVHPGMPEVAANGTDDNCNALFDEVDVDGDGHFSIATGGDDCCDNGSEPLTGCDPFLAWTFNPEAVEIPYDGVDQDCSGADLVDVDGDGFIAVQVVGGDDCDDNNPLTSPARPEDCQDPTDNNCNGTANEACGPGLDEDVYVAQGPFTMGRPLDDTLFADQTPDHVVTLGAYYIDKYEVTVSQYRRCVVTGQCRINILPPWSLSDEAFWYNQARGLAPALQVSWTDADDYCRWAGKQLPTEAQWEKAARGAGAATKLYPWGDVEWQVPPEGGAPVRVAIECSQANHRQLCDQIPCEDDVMPVDSYPTGASDFGALNLAGNVMEWVADWYDPNYYAVSPPDDPAGPGNTGSKVVRGGSFHTVDYYLEVTSRWPIVPTARNYDLGFRCARLPPVSP